jgi:hypothetical protein
MRKKKHEIITLKDKTLKLKKIRCQGKRNLKPHLKY